MKRFRRRYNKKKKGFGSREAEGFSGVFWRYLWSFIFKRGKNNIIINGQKSITSDFPSDSPA